MARLEMEGNQITLDSLEKGIDNPAFSSLGEEELCEERGGPRGGNEKRREGNGRVALYCRKALRPASKAKRFCKAHAKALRRVFWGLLGAAYLCYFIAACWLNFQRALALVVITAVVIFFVCWSLFKKYCGAKVLTLLSPLWKCLQKSWPWLKWLLYVLLLGGLVTWLALDTAKNPEQLISLAGFCVLVLFLFAFSKHHSAVRFSGVAWRSQGGGRGEIHGLSAGSRSSQGRSGHSMGSTAGCCSPSAALLLSFPLLNPGLPHSTSVLFSTTALIPRPMSGASGACGPRNVLVDWAEATEVSVAFSPTFSNVLDNLTSPALSSKGLVSTQ